MSFEINPNAIYTREEVAEMLGVKVMTFTNSPKYKPLRDKRTLGKLNGRYFGTDITAFLESTRKTGKPKARGRNRLDVASM